MHITRIVSQLIKKNSQSIISIITNNHYLNHQRSLPEISVIKTSVCYNKDGNKWKWHQKSTMLILVTRQPYKDSGGITCFIMIMQSVYALLCTYYALRSEYSASNKSRTQNIMAAGVLCKSFKVRWLNRYLLHCTKPIIQTRLNRRHISFVMKSVLVFILIYDMRILQQQDQSVQIKELLRMQVCT